MAQQTAAAPRGRVALPLKDNKPNLNRRAAGSNWQQHLQKCTTEAVTIAHAKTEENEPTEPQTDGHNQSKTSRLRQRRKAALLNKFVAMDCEMVGVGIKGEDDMLARVSIVNKLGEILLDKFVKPTDTVTDYRTSVSGVRPHDIANGEDFNSVQDEVVTLLQGKVLVGHAIRNDLAVLHIKHPYVNIRDTSRYKPLSRLISNGRTPSLKRLSEAILGWKIQTGEHSSVEDARAAMFIYNRIGIDWEKHIKQQQSSNGYYQN